jgi:hypothetical protein
MDLFLHDDTYEQKQMRRNLLFDVSASDIKNVTRMIYNNDSIYTNYT